jgi:hypothetical protein
MSGSNRLTDGGLRALDFLLPGFTDVVCRLRVPLSPCVALPFLVFTTSTKSALTILVCV